MKSFFITFRSITYAQRGEKALSQAGITCRMRRTPRWMEEQGCGHGLEMKLRSLEEGLAILRRQQIPWRKAWRLDPEGAVEEVRHDLL